MQQAGGDGRRVETQLGKDPGNLDTVLQEWLPGLAGLALVGDKSEVVGPYDEVVVGGLIGGGDLDEKHLQLQMVTRRFQVRI